MDNWDTFPHYWIPAPNISSGFHAIMFAQLEKYGPGGTCILVAENPIVIPVFQTRFPNTKFATLGYSGAAAGEFEQDLNILYTPEETYDSVFSQATLEHVCRPSTFLENLTRLCNPEGIIVIHTVGPGCIVHRIPVDCVRFLRDFWFEQEKYLPITVLAYTESGPHQFITYRRTEDRS